jgi:hypothetical protein
MLRFVLFAAAALITVRCYDWETGAPLGGRELTVYSDNGLRCVKTPCDTGGREWRGRTDQNGAAAIPGDVLQKVHTFSLPGYKSITLHRALKDGEKVVFRKSGGSKDRK